MPTVLDKKADLAGPGIGDYTELEKVLPRDAALRAVFASIKAIGIFGLW